MAQKALREMCVRLRFGDKLVSTSLKVDTKPGV